MSPTQPLPPKKDVALALLERSSVYVHLDPRQPAVVVPPWFKKQAQLVLQIGLKMPVPIPDLRLDDDGLSCTLSFNRAPFFCVVPWASVFAMVGDDGRGMVWPEDVPAEVTRQAQVRAVDGGTPAKEPSKPAAVAREPKAEGTKPKRPRKRPALSAVSEGGGGGGEGAPAKSSHASERSAHAATPVAGPRPAETPARLPRSTRKRRKELPPYLRVVK